MVGESNYTECLVKRAGRASDTVIKVLMLFGVLVLGFLALITPGFHQFLMVLLLVFYCFFVFGQWARFKAEYEYIFVDGQIDFDVVYSGNSRKHLNRIDMDKVDTVAPEGDHALDGFKHLELKAKDYSSRAQGAKVYVIMVKGEKGPEKILFEPDENFLQFMKKKAPRKVIL